MKNTNTTVNKMMGRHYTLAMIDVDHFKKFNDTYGHDVGDLVLKMVAHQISQVNGGGKAYRYGGEEFTTVFANKSIEETLDHLEDVRASIASKTRQLSPETVEQLNGTPGKGKKKNHSGEVSVTISIGAAKHRNKQNRYLRPPTMRFTALKKQAAIR